MNRQSISAVAVVILTAALLPAALGSNFIYVANAGEDTVTKIDVTTNTEVARYATWFTAPDPNFVQHYPKPCPTPPSTQSVAHQGPAPSRIARDNNDNAYVLDRFFNPSHLPVLLKIAPTGGALGSTTSNSSTPLAIRDTTTSTPVNIDPGEAKDVRILWANPIGTTGSDEGKLGRAVCMDPSGYLWVGIFSSCKYYKVNPATGIMVPGISVSTGTPGTPGAHYPYGCEVDMNGKLWSVDSGGTLAEIDTLSATLVASSPLNHSANGANYSVSIYNDCKTSPPKVTVYLSSRAYGSTAGKSFTAYDPASSAFTNPATQNFESVSVGVDRHGDVFSGEVGTGKVTKFHPNGSVVWNSSGTISMLNLHGIIIDDFDDVWAVDWFGSRVVKYSGASGAWQATVPVGCQPYTYGNAPPPTCGGNTGDGDTGGGCAPVKGDVRCLPNGDYSYTFTVTNNSGHDVSQLLLTPAQGSTFTLAPQLANFSTPLQNGQSTTLTTTISGAKPGNKICFYVSLLADKEACCNIQVCLTLPPCGGVSPTPTVSSSLPPPLRQQAPRGRRRP
jgi:streptogramin lyase